MHQTVKQCIAASYFLVYTKRMRASQIVLSWDAIWSCLWPRKLRPFGSNFINKKLLQSQKQSRVFYKKRSNGQRDTCFWRRKSSTLAYFNLQKVVILHGAAAVCLVSHKIEFCTSKHISSPRTKSAVISFHFIGNFCNFGNHSIF